MNFKKRINGSLTDIPYYIQNTSTDTITTLPAVLYPTDTTATVVLKGNTTQNGTPTPDNPVMPDGCGNKTANLFSSVWEQGSINATDGQNVVAGTIVRTKDYIPIKPNTAYSFSRDISNGYMNVRLYRADKSYIGSGLDSTVRLISGSTVSNPMGTNTSFCCFEVIDVEAAYIRFNDASNNMATKWLMVEGEYTQQTMPDYEPFGYKIPISSANTTTPVYFGEVESTRRIKQLVLTGNESVSKDTGQDPTLYFLRYKHIQINSYCTHLRSVLSKPQSGEFSTVAQYDGYIFMNFGADIMNAQQSGNTVEGFKEYLAAQYAAGTPVTIWYVLAEPETGIVNEPLMRIGDYADTLSNVSIPVTAGGDTISVDTTVQPSEVTATYKGWHPVADVHERENGAWT